jgi:hypothetical protein
MGPAVALGHFVDAIGHLCRPLNARGQGDAVVDRKRHAGIDQKKIARFMPLCTVSARSIHSQSRGQREYHWVNGPVGGQPDEPGFKRRSRDAVFFSQGHLRKPEQRWGNVVVFELNIGAQPGIGKGRVV